MEQIFPEIKSIISHDLEYGVLPADSEDCSVFIEVEIGIKGQEGSEIFSCTIATPNKLAEKSEPFWGRGYLITPIFSWELVEQSLQKLLMHCSGKNWEEVSSKISKELHWEFDNYKF